MRYTRNNFIFTRENDDETREFGVLHFQTNPFFVGYLRLAKCIVYVPASEHDNASPIPIAAAS